MIDLEPQTLEEAVAEYLGNSTGIINLYDAERELMGKSGGHVSIEIFRHINGNRGIISKNGKLSIQQVAGNIVNQYESYCFDEQDVRNTIINLLLSGMTKTEMRLLITENRLREYTKEKNYYQQKPCQ